jgi:hypothetical protein
MAVSARTKPKNADALVLRGITAAADRKGISVKVKNGEYIVSRGPDSRAFASPDKAAAFLILCGVL